MLVKKLDKAREGCLANITEKDINLLELIQGVNNPQVKRDFLIKKEPNL